MLMLAPWLSGCNFMRPHAYESPEPAATIVLVHGWAHASRFRLTDIAGTDPTIAVRVWGAQVAAGAAVGWVICQVCAHSPPLVRRRLADLEPCMPHNKEVRGSNRRPEAVC